LVDSCSNAASETMIIEKTRNRLVEEWVGGNMLLASMSRRDYLLSPSAISLYIELFIRCSFLTVIALRRHITVAYDV